jgi:hypothetical protein
MKIDSSVIELLHADRPEQGHFYNPSLLTCRKLIALASVSLASSAFQQNMRREQLKLPRADQLTGKIRHVNSSVGNYHTSSLPEVIRH